ncbi:hypothetical protein NL676_008916 [Syzygium grande]|nr:hypothetical protein NL676_008916 [Syzygium grande]
MKVDQEQLAYPNNKGQLGEFLLHILQSCNYKLHKNVHPYILSDKTSSPHLEMLYVPRDCSNSCCLHNVFLNLKAHP